MLKPEVSIPVGLATAAVVYAVYSNATPPITDIRSSMANDAHIATSRKSATWIAAGIVSAISLIAKDPNIFIIGGLAVVAMDFWTRHANAVNPQTGKVDMTTPTNSATADMVSVGGGDVAAV